MIQSWNRWALNSSSRHVFFLYVFVIFKCVQFCASLPLSMDVNYAVCHSIIKNRVNEKTPNMVFGLKEIQIDIFGKAPW